jgi:hypothetical protein
VCNTAIWLPVLDSLFPFGTLVVVAGFRGRIALLGIERTPQQEFQAQPAAFAEVNHLVDGGFEAAEQVPLRADDRQERGADRVEGIEVEQQVLVVDRLLEGGRGFGEGGRTGLRRGRWRRRGSWSCGHVRPEAPLTSSEDVVAVENPAEIDVEGTRWTQIAGSR